MYFITEKPQNMSWGCGSWRPCISNSHVIMREQARKGMRTLQWGCRVTSHSFHFSVLGNWAFWSHYVHMLQPTTDCASRAGALARSAAQLTNCTTFMSPECKECLEHVRTRPKNYLSLSEYAIWASAWHRLRYIWCYTPWEFDMHEQQSDTFAWEIQMDLSTVRYSK